MKMRRRLALLLLTLGASLMIAGGAGDLLLRTPPSAWDAVIGASAAALPSGAVRLLLTLLHSLGSALVAAGVAVLALVYGPLRRGERWAAAVIVVVTLLSDGVNAWGMASLGLEYFWGPLAFAGIVLLGVLVAFIPNSVFSSPLPEALRSGNGAT